MVLHGGEIHYPEFARNTVAPLNIPCRDERERKRFEIKMTGAAGSNHRFEGAPKEALTQISTFNTSSSWILPVYTRQTPAQLFANQLLRHPVERLFVEGRFSRKTFQFIGSGSPYTDLIRARCCLTGQGSLLQLPTFCGSLPRIATTPTCSPRRPFQADEEFGSHSIVAGYDRFNDIRQANNHQSGSDYRILGTTTPFSAPTSFPSGNQARRSFSNPIFSSSLGTVRDHSCLSTTIGASARVSRSTWVCAGTKSA